MSVRTTARFGDFVCRPLLEGSWVVINRGISPLIGVISITIVTPLITTHEPPSRRIEGCDNKRGLSVNLDGYKSPVLGCYGPRCRC